MNGLKEVLKFSENYLTGERIELKCLKPEGTGGCATIQLFRDGEEIQKTVSPNIIPCIVDEREWYRYMYRQTAWGGIPQAMGQGARFSPSNFRNIVLSSSDRVEDASNPFFDGSVVGWCPRSNTDAKSNKLRGTYNPSESYSLIEDGYYHAHLVYDFTTSQGNGTIGSVWWAKAVSHSHDEAPYPSNTAYDVVHPDFCIEGYSAIGLRDSYDMTYIYSTQWQDQYWVHGNPTGGTGEGYYRVNDGNSYVQGLEPLARCIDLGSKVTSIHAVPTSKCKYKEDKNVVISASNSPNNVTSNFTLAIKDKDYGTVKECFVDLYADEVISKYIKLGGNNSNRMYITGIREVNTSGDVMLQIYCQSYHNNIPKYVASSDSLSQEGKPNDGYCFGIYNVESESWTLKPDFDNVMCRRNTNANCVNFYDKFVVEGRTFQTRGGNDNQIMEEKAVVGREYAWTHHNHNMYKISNDYDYFQFIGKLWGNNNILLVRCTNNGAYTPTFVEIIPSYSAHTKLPNPVVKTSVDTMKVTYDYYIQLPYIYAEDGNYLGYVPKNPPSEL